MLEGQQVVIVFLLELNDERIDDGRRRCGRRRHRLCRQLLRGNLSESVRGQRNGEGGGVEDRLIIFYHLVKPL